MANALAGILATDRLSRPSWTQVLEIVVVLYFAAVRRQGKGTLAVLIERGDHTAGIEGKERVLLFYREVDWLRALADLLDRA